MNRLVSVSLMTLVACAGEEAAKPDEAAKPAPVTSKPVESPAAASDDGLAKKPKARVPIEGLHLSIEVPEGTTVSPPRNADDASTSAHLAQGKFMVNVRSVDEYSTASLAEARKVSSSDKLLASIRADETPTGWIVVREIQSSLHEKAVVEMSVRTEVAGKKWDCSVAAPNRAYAELALAACQSLAPTTVAPAEAAPPKAATRRAPAKRIAKAPTGTMAGGAVQGSLSQDAIGKVIRGARVQFQRCHERGTRSEASVNAIFVIGANGKVSAVSATGADTKLADCVAAVFRGFSFTPPSDGKPVKVSYPIRFAAG